VDQGYLEVCRALAAGEYDMAQQLLHFVRAMVFVRLCAYGMPAFACNEPSVNEDLFCGPHGIKVRSWGQAGGVERARLHALRQEGTP
jgi:hypothetical protein